MSRTRTTIWILALMLLVAPAVRADVLPLESQLRGSWQGELPAKNGKTLRIVLKVWRERADLLARIYSPDQDDREYVVEVMRLKERRVELDLPVIDASYNGTMSEDGSEIHGRWTQRGVVAPLVFRRVLLR